MDLRQDLFSPERFSGEWLTVPERGKASAVETLMLQLVGANRKSRPVPLEQQAGKINYLIGNDSSAWRKDVPTYRKVSYGDVYRNIDLVYYGNPQQMEFDFEVRPGGDPADILVEFPGAAPLHLDGAGNLTIHAGRAGADDARSAIKLHAPVTYQMAGGVRREIATRFVMQGPTSVGFVLADYDHAQPLVIDPVMTYSTFLGGGVSNTATIVIQ
ncbi:MAG: hypothetical protein EXQ56_11600 [Acidobacteria bacterium]|nr:hypothetical protein [Acidobacteriota bacterium]